MTEEIIRDWIVIHGSLIDTPSGGGFEFFGPFTHEEAIEFRAKILAPPDLMSVAVQLLKGGV